MSLLQGKLELRKYRPEDYEQVCSLFSSGMKELTTTAIADCWNGTKPKTLICHLGILFMSLLVGTTYFTFLSGLYFFGLFEGCFMAMIYFELTLFVNQHLNTDMSDTDMKFWTTAPHCFLVVSMGSKILGIVAMQKQSDEIAELNRLSVRPDTRGLGLGKRLVTAILEEADRNGFEEVVLVTSNIQKAAVHLYQKMGFKKLEPLQLEEGLASYFPDVLHGVHKLKYSYKLQTFNKD